MKEKKKHDPSESRAMMFNLMNRYNKDVSVSGTAYTTQEAMLRMPLLGPFACCETEVEREFGYELISVALLSTDRSYEKSTVSFSVSTANFNHTFHLPLNQVIRITRNLAAFAESIKELHVESRNKHIDIQGLRENLVDHKSSKSLYIAQEKFSDDSPSGLTNFAYSG